MKIELSVSELRTLLEPVKEDYAQAGPQVHLSQVINETQPAQIVGQLKRPAGTDMTATVVDDIVYHLYRLNTIRAIQRYKEHYRTDLKTAKDNVIALRDVLDKIFP